MCQAIPRRVLEVAPGRVQVDYDGRPIWVDAQGLPGLEPGEYVVVYAGAALERMAEDEARELLDFFDSLETMLAEADAALSGAEERHG